MLGSVIVEAIVSSLNLGRVSRAQDEIVRLGLLKQLLDCFKALWCLRNYYMEGWKAKHTKPDEMPVATIVFAMVLG